MNAQPVVSLAAARTQPEQVRIIGSATQPITNGSFVCYVPDGFYAGESFTVVLRGSQPKGGEMVEIVYDTRKMQVLSWEPYPAD